MKQGVSIVIPAYNEERLLPITLTNLVGRSWINEIIVVDDGSTDKTIQEVKKFDVQLIRLTENVGKSKALHHGTQLTKSELVMFLDADLTYTAYEAERMLHYLMVKELDCVIAALPCQKRKGFGFMKRRAQKLIFSRTGRWLSAPLSGQRILKKQWIDKIFAGEYVGFGVEMAMTIDLIKAGAKVEELEVPFYHRSTGKDVKGFVHRFKQWKDMEKTLWRMRSTW